MKVFYSCLIFKFGICFVGSWSELELEILVWDPGFGCRFGIQVWGSYFGCRFWFQVWNSCFKFRFGFRFGIQV